MSTVLFLGASASQVNVLRTARILGHTVVVCDWSKDAPGFKFADVVHRISTTDIAGVGSVFGSERCDAIVAYASDPAALTAAVVAGGRCLPGNPIKAVDVLTHKNKYRQFLKENGFNTPLFSQNNEDFRGLHFPVIVKPTDLSGSKGVSIAQNEDAMPEALAKAKRFSRSGDIVVEEVLNRKGYQVAGDGFVVDGKLVFRCFANEHFDSEGLVPIGESFPSVLSEEIQQNIHNEIQRALTLLGMERGALNFDVIIDRENKAYLIEIGPRAGGCLIPDVIKLATGFDEAEYVIKSALGEDCSAVAQRPVVGFWSSYMVHSLRGGLYKGMYVAAGVKANVVSLEMLVEEGDPVSAYEHSGCAIGTAILRFKSKDEMLYKMGDMASLIQVEVA